MTEKEPCPTCLGSGQIQVPCPDKGELSQVPGGFVACAVLHYGSCPNCGGSGTFLPENWYACEFCEKDHPHSSPPPTQCQIAFLIKENQVLKTKISNIEKLYGFDLG